MRGLAVALMVWCVALLSSSEALAQQRCNNRDTINCEFHPEFGWIIRGSAPVTVSPSLRAREQGRGPRSDPDAYNKAVAREVREDAEKIAAMKPLGERFQSVFDKVSVEEYGGYIFNFKELNRRTYYTIGSSGGAAEMQATRRNSAYFLGPLFIRMAVACIELERATKGKGCTEDAMTYLLEARNLDYPDAHEMMNQIVTLGLDSLFDKK